jgi:hypothetical protein
VRLANKAYCLHTGELSGGGKPHRQGTAHHHEPAPCRRAGSPG